MRVHLSYSRSEKGLNTANRKDQNYALALVGLADCYSISALFGYSRPRTIFPRAREFALRALKVGDDLAETHASMGEVLIHYSYD